MLKRTICNKKAIIAGGIALVGTGAIILYKKLCRAKQAKQPCPFAAALDRIYSMDGYDYADFEDDDYDDDEYMSYLLDYSDEDDCE